MRNCRDCEHCPYALEAIQPPLYVHVQTHKPPHSVLHLETGALLNNAELGDEGFLSSLDFT